MIGFSISVLSSVKSLIGLDCEIKEIPWHDEHNINVSRKLFIHLGLIFFYISFVIRLKTVKYELPNNMKEILDEIRGFKDEIKGAGGE